MSAIPVSVVVALAVASSVGFAGGYVFHATVGTEISAARQAVFEAQSTQRVLQAFEPVVRNSEVHKELSAVQSLADAQRLALKYKEATLRSVESFERGASQLELPREQALAAPFLQEAQKIRSAVSAAP